MNSNLTRRALLLAAAATAVATTWLTGCASAPAADVPPPIVFVHGNGDTAALWTTTLWRFESNGWPRDRLFAIDVPYPQARDDDTKPQDGRTSTAQNMQYLAAEVDRVLAATGASCQTANLTLIGALGAEVMATAVLRAVRAATRLSGPGLPDLPAARDP